ncbi:MAP9 protein, partial [Fregetta grallaria]|nr:MAP9 protein [Fregetta grallaria]
DKLQEAISAHAAREQTDEYSDDFESDEDGMLNGTGEELNESNSGDESTKKPVAVESPLSDDDASQKAADLENEAADDLTLSFHEKKLQQIMLLESENIQDDRKDGEEEYLGSQNEGDDRKNNEECSAAEEVPCGHSESDHCNDLPIGELQEKRNQEENKPIPKPRVHKTRNASASDGCYKPLPQPRSMLRKSGPVEDNELNRSEGKITSRNGLSSFSAPSSLATLNAHATPKKKLLAESPGPEDPWLESTSPPFSINFTSHNERSGDSNLLICGEAPLTKDQEIIFFFCLKLEDNSRKFFFLIEVTMTTVYVFFFKLEKSTDDSSFFFLEIVEGQIVTFFFLEVSVDDQSELFFFKNTSKASVKKHYLVSVFFFGKIIDMFASCFFFWSLSPAHLKKFFFFVPSATPISSQYLGTLKVLEDKRLFFFCTRFDQADSLFFFFFQVDLKNKQIFFFQNNQQTKLCFFFFCYRKAVKREEAIASFEAWKKKKGKEAKQLSEKKKLEELKKKEAAEQNEEKTEAAQKAFEKWKERKAGYLREQSRKEKQSERIKKKKEEELVAEKKRDSMSAVEKWNEKKEEYMKQKKIEKKLERRQQEMQQAKKEEKNKKAMEEYERWL